MKPQELFDRLVSDDFEFQLGAMTSPAHLRDRIRRTSEFQDLRKLLREGVLSERLIREFSGRLTHDFRPGTRLPHETALVLLALLMEEYFTPFAEEFIADLARLQLAEVGNAIRVAQLVARLRAERGQTKRQTIGIPLRTPVEPRIFVDQGHPIRSRAVETVIRNAAA